VQKKREHFHSPLSPILFSLLKHASAIKKKYGEASYREHGDAGWDDELDSWRISQHLIIGVEESDTAYHSPDVV
jgi:hypothetical protein